MVSLLFTRLGGVLFLLTYNSIHTQNWCILPHRPSCRWCAVSLTVIWRNSATRRSYAELYICVCCWWCGESLFWCFSVNRATIQLKRTNVSILTPTWLVMLKSYKPIYTVVDHEIALFRNNTIMLSICCIIENDMVENEKKFKIT